MVEGRGTKIILGIAITLALALVGFPLYQTFIGEGEIGTVVLFAFISIVIIGLVKLGISTTDTRLDLNNFIPIVLMIGTPIVVLFLIDKWGIKHFLEELRI